VARELLREAAPAESYRLIGVGLSDFIDAADSAAADLFAADDARALVGEKTIDRLRERFGDGAVVRGSSLER